MNITEILAGYAREQISPYPRNLKYGLQSLYRLPLKQGNETMTGEGVKRLANLWLASGYHQPALVWQRAPRSYGIYGFPSG
jgi:hypothetical protein